MLVYGSGGKLENPNRTHDDHIKSLQLQGDLHPGCSGGPSTVLTTEKPNMSDLAFQWF